MADRPLAPKPMPQSGKPPAPESVPKLPQTIFHLEKRGGAEATERG